MKRSHHITRTFIIFLALVAWAIRGQAQTAKDTQSSAISIVKEFLDAAQHMDHHKAEVLLDPNLVWEQPGNSQVSGIKRSADSMFSMIGQMIKISNHTIKLTEIKAITANGNKVACLVHWKAIKPSGEVFDVDNIDVYTIENGKIVHATIFSADLDQENKFWGQSN